MIDCTGKKLLRKSLLVGYALSHKFDDDWCNRSDKVQKLMAQTAPNQRYWMVLIGMAKPDAAPVVVDEIKSCKFRVPVLLCEVRCQV